MEDPIPENLPALSPWTISLYRRSDKAVYKTRVDEAEVLDPHMTY